MTPYQASRVLSGSWPRRELFCQQPRMIRLQSIARNKRWANPHSEITINPTGKGAK